MPEKIADKVETNGRPMPEKVPEKIEETARKYMRQAEDVAEDTFRAYNELMATTTKYYFDTLDRTVRETMEITKNAEHNVEEMMTIYRRVYTEGIKSWQTYFNEINKLIVRPK
jgi:uncharacterized protein Yka (UPF0111/DUF47 family)